MQVECSSGAPQAGPFHNPCFELSWIFIEFLGIFRNCRIRHSLKFALPSSSSSPAPPIFQVNYRESISKPAEIRYVHKKQSGGSGQFADVAIRFEPAESGSGFEFRSEIKGGVVPKEYIPGVEKGLSEMMNNGVLAGFPVVDMTCTLIDGSYHDVDSSALAFQIAARAAFREGMRKGAPKLLEPIMKVEVITPEDNLGDVIGDLNSRRGMVSQMTDKVGGLKVVQASVPLSEMFQYVSRLRSMTKGRASYSMQLSHYDPVPSFIQEKIQQERSGKVKVTE